MTCGRILFTEADRAVTLTHQLVSYPCLVTYQSITLSHIMTHDIMINERKKNGDFLLVSFYLYIMFVNHNE